MLIIITHTPFLWPQHNSPWHPPDQMGPYGAVTPPMESNNGYIESPRPPLLTGASGAAVAVKYCNCFHHWWWSINFGSSSSMLAVIYDRGHALDRYHIAVQYIFNAFVQSYLYYSLSLWVMIVIIDGDGRIQGSTTASSLTVDVVFFLSQLISLHPTS